MSLAAGRAAAPSAQEIATCRWLPDAEFAVYAAEYERERMQAVACARMVGCHLLDGAGHWVPQEQAARVTELLLDFVKG